MLNWNNVLILLSGSLALCGCARDPEKEKQKYVQSGLGYVQKTDYDAAIIQFRNALRHDPKSVDTLHHLAQAYLANRQGREAYATLMQALAVDPNRTDVRVNLGRLYLQAGEYQKAEEQAAFLIHKDNNNVAAQQILGASFAARQENEKAVQTFQKVAQLAPKDASSFANLGISFANLGNRAEAEVNFQKAIGLDPHHVQGWLAFANLQRRNGQLARAEQILQTGLAQNSDDLTLHLTLADVYLQRSKNEAFETLLSSLRKRLPKAETALALGEFFVARNQPQRALSEYQWGAGLSPANVELKARLVEIYATTGKLTEAEKLNSDILRERPKDVQAGIAQGRILLGQGKRDEAVAALREQVSRARDSAPAHYYLGLAYIRNMNSEQAKTELRDAVRLQPSFVAARHTLTELHLSLGELVAARQIAEETVRMNPKGAATRLLLASVLLKQGTSAAAREHLTVARELAPADPAIPAMFGASYAAEKKIPEAQREYEAALKLDPNYAPARAQLSALWANSGQSGKAVAALQQQVAARPNDAETHFLLGSLYRQNRDYGRAEAEFNQVAKLAPNRIEPRLELGAIYQEQDRWANAIEQYEAALKIEPRSASVHALLGTARMKIGESDLARRHFEQGLALDPNSAVIANNLAFTNAATGGNLDVAFALAQKARELAPTMVHAADTLGWIQYKKGLYPSAVRLLEECVRKDPQSASFKYHLGMALIAAGEREKGRSQLDSALRLKLSSEEAAQARNALAKLR